MIEEQKETLKFESMLNNIILGDSMEVMKHIPDNSIDLIFADPPYNLQLENDLYRPNETKVNGVSEEWDKFKSFKDYDDFTFNWLSECKRILKKSGTIWVIGSYHNIFRVGKIMQDLGYWILNDIIWIKTNPMPNFKGTRFNNAHETLIWASKDKESKYTFNYKTTKSYNDDLQMRSDWYIPICQGEERIKFNGQKAHPTQKPEALLYRIINATSKPSDIILDPFAGTGTTLAVAKKLGRYFIGIEKEKIYVDVCKERLSKATVFQQQLLDYPLEIKPKRLPFGSLIENDYIKPGEYLYSQNEKYKALALANGTLLYGDKSGSIHKISAMILNKPANNGWTFWYVKRGNRLISINDFRRELLRKI
ncbi:MAG: site-specific DNA-methyltransferase [Nitrososphaerota archaeon]|jgi:site-specific DNA-methyltransferase (adenine-specific)/modification methylase|nr:site-specific DNA-methyltransferase [Nitrososphaerota archaeon]MDG7036913.1 site-specific DNA-methyltransferase [Nitrososphaerota archaeon]MDG7037631.1 site-specific DNA-methyltransferase [Nitrososphaerota archaeon]